jgi:recombination protein RecA
MTKEKDILDILEKKLQKDYGENIIIQGNHLKSGKLISTGSLGLDIILGGGIREGTILELYGRPSSGKSSIALYMAAEAQNAGKRVVYFDVEHALKPALLKTINKLDIKELKISRPEYAEQTCDIMENYIKSGESVFLVLDSIAALVQEKEAEAEHQQETMMGVSKLMSKTLRKLTGPCARSNSVICYINQLREKPTMYGNPEIRPGGRALGFHATYEIDIRTKGTKDFILDDNGNIIGHNITAKITKNKLYMPFKTTVIPLLYGIGFDIVSELINIATELAVITQKGPYYYLGDKSYQGKNALYKELTENKDVSNKIKEDILKLFNFEV